MDTGFFSFVFGLTQKCTFHGNFTQKVKEWLHSIGIVDQTAVVQDDEEPDDGAVPLHHDESVRNK